jgi:hypothetical protein
LGSRSLTSTEFIIPLSSSLRKNILLRPQNSMEQQQKFLTSTYIPAMGQFLAVRPKLIKEEEYVLMYQKSFVLVLVYSFKVDRERKLLVPPPFNVSSLKEYVMNSLTEAIEKSSRYLRDPTGGTYANWLV